MASSLRPHSDISGLHANISKKRIGIITASWHADITGRLQDAAILILKQAGIKEENILTHQVPGAFELPLGAQYLLEYASADAVICIGCLIKGDTPHFHYISETVSLCLGQLGMRANRPVGFGVLTVDTIEQADARAGGEAGNKGEEAASAILQMLDLKERLKTKGEKGSIGFGAR